MGDVLPPIDPADEQETHMSQLAVWENFAQHGIAIQFAPEEAQALEDSALEAALKASMQDAHSTRCRMCLSPTPACMHTIISQLKSVRSACMQAVCHGKLDTSLHDDRMLGSPPTPLSSRLPHMTSMHAAG